MEEKEVREMKREREGGRGLAINRSLWKPVAGGTPLVELGLITWFYSRRLPTPVYRDASGHPGRLPLPPHRSCSVLGRIYKLRIWRTWLKYMHGIYKHNYII